MQIFVHRTGCMHHMLTYLSRGYHHHITGIVDATKVEAFASRFIERYEISTSAQQRWRGRKKGRASAILFLHPTYVSPAFHWWLMLTDGEHQALGEQRGWRDARQQRQRLTVGNNFEAILQPAPGAVPRWTWQFTDTFREELRAQVIEAIRHRRDARSLIRVFKMIENLPGFRELRHQAMALRRLAEGEWRRTKPAGTPLALPPLPPWVRYRSYRQVDLGLVVARLQAGLKPFANEWVQTHKPEAESSAEAAPPTDN
jgi:hypothetical protein